MVKKIFLILAIFLAGITANATDYYIAPYPTGNDTTGTGAIGSPWHSLYKATSTVAAGAHTIHVAAGTYNEGANQCSLRTGVSIVGVGDASHIITSYTSTSSYSGFLHLYSASLTDGNQSISYIKLDGNNITSNCAINVIDRNNVKIHHVTIVDFHSRGINIRHDGAGVTFITGTEIYNCIITNCADRLAGSSCGLIVNKGCDGTLIYNNVLTQNSRTATHNGNIYNSWGDYEKNTKFYNNICTKPDEDGALAGAGGWNFHLETGHCLGGVEIYNNTFIGGVAIDIAGGNHTKGSSDFSYWIHHNNHYCLAQQAWALGVPRTIFVDLERTCEDVIIERNYINKITEGISANLSDPGEHISNLKVRYNLFTDIGYTNAVARYGINVGTNNATAYVNGVEIDNNDFDLNGGYGGVSLYAYDGSTVENVDIRNNIVQNAITYGWLVFDVTTTGVYANITGQNNLIYNCPTNDTPYYVSGVTADYTGTNNKVGDPLFISTTNFRLQANSPAINAGTNVSLTSDYDGNPIVGLPDIGAFEYQTLPIPVTGLGWEDHLAKRNFKDDVNFAGRWMIDAVPITATAPEINYSVGVTSGIQGQLDAKAALSAPAFTTSITVTPGDTTVTAVVGKIVYKTSDNHLYICRQLTAKKWYQLDN